jgi:tRNA dimethylallyltransferase
MELILLLGSTSSGKSELAVELAKKLNNSVIISCDSRQVYKGLDLLSGKVEGKIVDTQFVYSGIKHYLIDIVDLDVFYNLNSYILDYINVINNLQNVDYVILTGGTGLYARAIYEEYQLNSKIVNQDLTDLSLVELQQLLNQRDFNNSDWNNKIRLINKLSASVENKIIIYPQYSKKTKYIIKIDKEAIKKRVHNRIIERLNNGMIEELELLLNHYSYAKMTSLGLESRYCSYYLLGMINIKELIRLLDFQTMQYVKRQLTWLNKEKEAIWINGIEDIKRLD